MLITLIALAVVFLSNAGQLFVSSAGEEPVAAENPAFRPEDPSTLTLALIGIGTLAVYITVRRGWRARSQAIPTVASTLEPAFEIASAERVEPIRTEVDQPSRGAA
jgi:hypothetical protein